MARDAVAITPMVLNDGIAPAAGTAINVTNGAEVAAGGNVQKLFIVVNNTAVSAKNVTIKAGAHPPALRAELGDLVVAVPNAATRYICIESAQFAQADGKIHIDFESGTTGTVMAYRLPKGL